ncbi:hypothetical protein OKW49_002811 [Paraburkholderia youngii]
MVVGMERLELSPTGFPAGLWQRVATSSDAWHAGRPMMKSLRCGKRAS